jgi:predicted Zn-dependent protease
MYALSCLGLEKLQVTAAANCCSDASQDGEQALRRLSAALELKGGVLTPHALHLLGDICRRNNQQQDASDAYRAALKANPLLWCSYEALCQLGRPRLASPLLICSGDDYQGPEGWQQTASSLSIPASAWSRLSPLS